MENIIENNKIIAEFLDWEFDDLSETFETPFLKLVEPQAFGDEQFSCKLQDFELEFHSDWNWLMSVVEKIESLSDEENNGKFFFEIYLDSAIIFSNGDYVNGLIEVMGQGSRINNVYQTCVEFIKWYNEQNKTNESL